MSRTPLGFMAMALSNSVALRWLNPWNCGRAWNADGGLTDKEGIVIPFAGTLRNFRVKCLTDPTAPAGSVTYTLVKNGVDTAIVLVAPLNAAHVAVDTVSTLSVAEGDYLTLKAIASQAASTNGVNINFAFQVDSLIDGHTFLHFGNDGANAGANTRFMAPYYGTTVYGTGERRIIAPRDGVLSRFHLVGTPGASANTMTHVVRVNGIDTLLSLVATDNVADFRYSNLANSVNVLRGDLISIKSVATGACGATRLSAAMRYEMAA